MESLPQQVHDLLTALDAPPRLVAHLTLVHDVAVLLTRAFDQAWPGMEWVWQFGLYPLDDRRTRLVDRGTERYAHTPLWWLFARMMEPAAFLMTRRFVLGVKERAEALHAQGQRPTEAARADQGAERAGADDGRGERDVGSRAAPRDKRGDACAGAISQTRYTAFACPGMGNSPNCWLWR